MYPARSLWQMWSSKCKFVNRSILEVFFNVGESSPTDHLFRLQMYECWKISLISILFWCDWWGNMKNGTMHIAGRCSYHGEQLINAFPGQQYHKASIHDTYAQVSIYRLIIQKIFWNFQINWKWVWRLALVRTGHDCRYHGSRALRLPNYSLSHWWRVPFLTLSFSKSLHSSNECMPHEFLWNFICWNVKLGEEWAPPCMQTIHDIHLDSLLSYLPNLSFFKWVHDTLTMSHLFKCRLDHIFFKCVKNAILWR